MDDRHWDDTVPRRTRNPPKTVQKCYTHSQYEVGQALQPRRHGRCSHRHVHTIGSDSYMTLNVWSSHTHLL